MEGKKYKLTFTLANGEAQEIVFEVPPGETGPQGIQGEPGATPYIGENGNWWVGETDTRVGAGGSAKAVRFDGPQELTPEQQAQARKNIGVDDVGGTGGSILAADDGAGNVVITMTGALSVTDDGNGNVIIS